MSSYKRFISHDAIDKAVASRLKQIRRQQPRKVTNDTAAAALQVSPPQYIKYESGVNRMTAGRLFLAAQLFRVPVDYFFTDVLEPREGASRPLTDAEIEHLELWRQLPLESQRSLAGVIAAILRGVQQNGESWENEDRPKQQGVTFFSEE